MAKLQSEAQLKAAQAQKTGAEAQAVLPKAHAEIEKNLAQAGHHHVDDTLAVAAAQNPQMDAMAQPPDWWKLKPHPPMPGGFDVQQP